MSQAPTGQQPSGEQRATMAQARRWWPLLALALGALALALLGQGQLRELLVVPLLRLFSAIANSFAFFSEISYWWFFVIVCVVAALVTLFASLRGGERRDRQAQPARVSQVAAWTRLISEAGQTEFYQRRLYERLAPIAHELLAQELRLPLVEVRRRLARGDFRQVDPALRPLFRERDPHGERPARRLPRLPGAGRQPQQLDPELVAIISALERLTYRHTDDKSEDII